VLTVAIVVAISGGVWFFVSRDTGSPSDNKKTARQDKTAPEIELNVPADTVLLSQEKKTLQVGIKTDEYDEIARVEYMLDGKLAAYSTTAPFVVDIDISALSLGEHTLYAIAYDVKGNISKSPIFTFTVIEAVPAEPSNPSSDQIIKRSVSTDTLKKNVNNGSGSNSGGNGDTGGGDSGGDEDTTPWPDDPPALVCGNTALLSGPSSAPAGAVVVPAGDNSSINLELPNKIYWFAPGTHTLGNAPLSQIEPGDNTTYVGAPGAILDGQNINQYAFTQHAVNVKVQYLTIQNFNTPQNEGNVNHDSGDGWTIEYSTIQNNGGAGVFGGSDNTIRYNCLKDNGQYGFQVFQNESPPTNVVLDHNEISGNNQDDWEGQIVGCGCTGGGKFWEASNVDITNNYIHNNLSVALWADTNDNDFLIENNYIADNDGQGIFYEISYNMIVRNNNFIRNALADGPGNPSFPTGAIYLSEAGGDSRVPARTAQIEIYDNNFEDNWSGVILWENADRFCNSPANTSTGTCTLVNPAATLTTCNDPALGGSIDDPPYYSDCRWKTNNVKVHDNVFSIDNDSISQCAFNKGCGYQGIFSNVGSFPSWSPYTGDVIQHDVTFNQGNLFSNNTYVGDWRFRAQSEDTVYNFAIWQASPFSQDTGSTYNGLDHLVVANAMDDDTATLEGSIGEWTSWFSSTVARTTEQAHTGTHSLKVTIDAPFGWGVQLGLARGFPVTPLDKSISFWGRLGSGTSLSTRMDINWLDEDGNSLRTDNALISPLTTSWQQVSVPITPPAGSRSVKLSLVHSSGTTGNTLYFDDFIVGDTE
jgi:hypothetical protein